MAYTKKLGSYCRVRLDQTDASNNFRSISVTMEDEELPVGAFSSTGFEDTLPGVRAQEITGQAYYTEEFYVLAYPLYINRTEFEMQVQPNGLVDSTREVYYGTGRITRWEAPEEFGAAALFDFRFRPSNSTGIVANDVT